jgi:hypothetical protein
MDQQKGPDQDGRDEDEREPRNGARDCIERLTVKERGVGTRRQCQERESNERNEVSAARPTRRGVETDE